MNLVRTASAVVGEGQTLSAQGKLPGHLLGVDQHAGDARRGAAPPFPGAAMWEADLKRLFLEYVETKQAQQVLDYDDLLLYWAQMVGEPELGREIGGASGMCWSTSTRTPTGCRRRSCWR
jgi:hypothetical protein